MTLKTVAFDIFTPVANDTIVGNIAHACGLGLPEADGAPIRSLTVIANGPSSRAAPLHGDTLALNGALNLFLNTGRTPTYWAACDPQEMVADFLPKDPPKEVVYLVASKCHPSVFARLKGRDVRLWHIDDHPIPEGLRSVPVASSVTLCAMSLMRKAFGYRHFDTWGWDGCYEEIVPGVIKHHASVAAITDYPEDVVTLYVGATPTKDGSSFEGGRPFKTSRTWAAEAQDACVQLHYADYQVTIHGDGLIRAIRESRA